MNKSNKINNLSILRRKALTLRKMNCYQKIQPLLLLIMSKNQFQDYTWKEEEQD